jgi:hypothetical protein
MSEHLTTEHTPLTADEWAERWQQEANARNELFQQIKAMREAIREAIEHLCNVGSGRGCLLGFDLDDAMPEIEAALAKLQPFTTQERHTKNRRSAGRLRRSKKHNAGKAS